MRVFHSSAYAVFAPLTLFVGVVPVQPSAGLQDMVSLPAVVQSVKMPRIEQPDWLSKRDTTTIAASQVTSLTGIVTYSVASEGNITADRAEFRQQANATLNDVRGWSRLGVVFQEVPEGGNFTIILGQAEELPGIASICSDFYSCQSGRYVIINQDRWLGATPPWNEAGKSLRDYRHLVINHETGHWLGHRDESCEAPGGPAGVMMQQSIDLEGCSFNSWPLESEMWSSQLGVE